MEGQGGGEAHGVAGPKKLLQPLTSQSHGSVSQREQLVFHYGSNSMLTCSNLLSRKSSVTSSAGLPNYFLKIFILILFVFKTLRATRCVVNFYGAGVVHNSRS
jgi:hypothetical protein